MSIWFYKNIPLEKISERSAGTLVEHLGIQITALRDDEIEGTMPVDNRTIQPYGILHGGASCVLAETLGSIASNLVLDPKVSRAVGLNIETSHIRPVPKENLVTGIAKAVHLGKKTHIWEIKIMTQDLKLVSLTRLTMMVVEI